jgi:hypothetical protein
VVIGELATEVLGLLEGVGEGVTPPAGEAEGVTVLAGVLEGEVDGAAEGVKPGVGLEPAPNWEY